MKKLIATDLDGTLLNKQHASSTTIRQAIKHIIANPNHIFAIATGRHLHPNHRVGLNFLDLPIYKICMNGALIKGPHNDVLKEFPINRHIVYRMLHEFPEISFEIITQSNVYVHRKKWEHFQNMTIGKASLNRRLKYVIASITGQYQYQSLPPLSEKILKIDCRVGDVVIAERLHQYIERHKDFIRNSGPNIENFEMTANDVHKQSSIEFLRQHVQINTDNVYVFGNDINDVEMLHYYPNSYVPINAVQAAKEAASNILPLYNGNQLANYMKDVIKD